MNSTARSLRNKNILAKNKQYVQTLGDVTVITTDIAGLVSRNKMTIAGMWLNAQRHEIAVPFDSRVFEETVTVTTPNLLDMLKVFSLCSK